MAAMLLTTAVGALFGVLAAVFVVRELNRHR